MRVVLVRPWTDAHAGSGCCSGEARHGICLDRPASGSVEAGHGHDPEVVLAGEAFRRLRAEFPDVDVQLVGAGNTAYLLPSVFRQVRRRSGLVAALRASARATTAGAVLIDGCRVGDLSRLGVEGVLAEVGARRTPSGATHR